MLNATFNCKVWSRHRRLRPNEHNLAIAFWRDYLSISQEVRAEKISPYQVTDERGRSGSSLTGVTFTETQAIIYHTRALTGEDIIHELLHVSHSDWNEQMVVQETDRLVVLMSSCAKQISPKLGYAPV